MFIFSMLSHETLEKNVPEFEEHVSRLTHKFFADLPFKWILNKETNVSMVIFSSKIDIGNKSQVVWLKQHKYQTILSVNSLDACVFYFSTNKLCMRILLDLLLSALSPKNYKFISIIPKSDTSTFDGHVSIA